LANEVKFKQCFKNTTDKLLPLPTLLPEGSFTDFHFLLTHWTYFASPAINDLLPEIQTQTVCWITPWGSRT